MTKRHGVLAVLGPGLAMAAFGIGAGDTTTTALGGARYGLVLLWVPLVASVFKFVLNEGLARWQLATGETLVEGWALRMGPIVRYGFLVYFLIWAIPAFGTLISTSGLTADLMLPLAALDARFADPIFAGGPRLAIVAWAVTLVVFSYLLIRFGRYALFERIMSVLALGMVLATLAAALALPTSSTEWRAIAEKSWIPPGSLPIVFALMGGMGPTVGILAYSYWMRERRREGPEALGVTRIDLAVSYLATGVFGVAMIVLAGGIESGRVREILGLAPDAAIEQLSIEQVFRLVRHRLTHEAPVPASVGQVIGATFGVSLWATVFSSLLGLLQSIPYLCVDYLTLLRRSSEQEREAILRQTSRPYRVFLFLLAFAPIPLVAWKRPTAIIVAYALWGSLFMPFLAATLLYMNNRSDWVGRLKSRRAANLVLAVCWIVFLMALARALVDAESRRISAEGPGRSRELQAATSRRTHPPRSARASVAGSLASSSRRSRSISPSSRSACVQSRKPEDFASRRRASSVSRDRGLSDMTGPFPFQTVGDPPALQPATLVSLPRPG